MKLSRLATITKVFAEEGIGFLTEKQPDPEAGKTVEQLSSADVGRRLRRALERLGPTFVKFGQMLGTRVDLFSPEVISELSQLHSRVAPFPTDVAHRILEAELGAPIAEVFSEISEVPVAAASIAQVYRARLAGAEPASVAVKVQRPDLETNLLADLDMLVELSRVIDALVPPYRRAMVHEVAEEYCRRARQEIDFRAEVEAMEAFADVLATLPEFRVPTVHRERCTARVLVMEWLEGAKLDTLRTKADLVATGFDPHEFSRSMLRLQLSMSYEHGIVHGDTHPGNIILLPNGQIGLIDFGLHARVPRLMREKMLETLFYQSSGRVDEAVAAFVTVLRPGPEVDRAAVEAALKGALSAALDSKRPGAQDGVAAELIDAMRVASKHRLKVPSELFMVVRNLTIVEGLIKRYAPELDPASELETITGTILRRKLFGASMREEISQLLPQLILTLSKRPQLVQGLLRLERSFVDSKNLGDFLRRERVLTTTPPRSGYSAWVLALFGLLGGAVGYAIHLLPG